MSSDRRRYKRVSPDKSSPIYVDINGDNFLEVLKASDLSEGGIGVTVPHRFKGCIIHSAVSFLITVPLPNKITINLTGKIKHVSGDRFGVSFTHVSDYNRAVLKRYISMRIKEESLLDWVKYKVGVAV